MPIETSKITAFVMTMLFLSLQGSTVSANPENCSNADILIKSNSSAGKQKSEEEILNKYKDRLRHKIARAWFPPKDASPVKYSFEISADGTVSKPVCLAGEDCFICCKAALAAINNAGPFGSLPLRYLSKIEVICEFEYMLGLKLHVLAKSPLDAERPDPELLKGN